jgi:hypothetical protein
MDFHDLAARLECTIDPALLGPQITRDDVRKLAVTVTHVLLDAMADNAEDECHAEYLELVRAGIMEGVMLSDVFSESRNAH